MNIWKGKELAPIPGLEFNPDGHIYKVNGRQLKSVTGYTSKLQDHSFCSEIDMQWGSTVHDYLFRADTETLDFDSPEFDHRFIPYILGWTAFCGKQGWGFKKMLAEYSMYSPKYLYSGTLDRIFETEKYDFLIDIKTGAPSAVTGMQLAAYAQAAIEHSLTNKTRLKLMEVCIDRDGKVRSQIFDFKSNWNYFLMAYSLQNRYLK